MINEEKVILMTKLTSYETGKGKKDVAIGNYFSMDYVGLGVLKSMISVTIAFVIFAGMYVIYDIEEFMQNIYKMDLLAFGKRIGIIYLCVVAVYSLISYAFYAYRFNMAKKNIRAYYHNLKKLAQMYDK